MNGIPSIFWLVPLSSIVALGFAWAFYKQMLTTDEGTPRMCEIAAHVRKGAMAYLKQQYKVVFIAFIVLALLFAFMAYVLKVQNPWVSFAFPYGWSLLWFGWFLWHEDRHLCLWSYGQCGSHGT